MGIVLREIFGNTKRIRILEELVENWGEFLTIEEIARIAETSPKTAYRHINDLSKVNILQTQEKKPKKFKLKENDKRAIALAILESEEYLRKTEITLDQIKTKEEIKNRSFIEFNNSKVTDLKLKKDNHLTLIEADAK